LNDKTGKLIWFLFLDNSNPFIKAELENDSCSKNGGTPIVL